MKKALLLLLISTFYATLATAQPGGKYEVSSAREFLEAIGSQRTIIVLPGEYDFASVSDMYGENFSFLEAFDGMELQINGVASLTIEGSENWQSHLITQPKYGHVIRFKGCQAIKISDIKAGHGPERGYCTGGVFFFEGCQGVTVEDCHLYGSGTEGLTFNDCADISVSNTIIKSCTYSILSLMTCQGAVFKKCKFFDNQEFELVNIRNSDDITFKSCTFNRNRTDYNFFSTNAVTRIVLKKCRFEENSAGHFAASEDKLVLKRTKFFKNEWKKGKFKE